MIRGPILCAVLSLPFGVLALAQEQSLPVTVCQLQDDPAAYNHRLVEVTAFVSHAFEDFSLSDLACHSSQGVWLEYGGRAKSGTMYCCGETADRHRLKQLKVEDIPIPLVDNKQFREFEELVQPPFRSGRYGAVVHATLVGRFFSGRKFVFPTGTFWGGYGHMGCCSLLAIQEVKSVDAQIRDDLDYGASNDQPDIGKAGCGFRFLTPLDPHDDLLRAQRDAERGQRDWVFEDPKRVAIDALSRFANVEERSIMELREIRKAQGRYVYECKPAGKEETYFVVVSRPYVLSFYARDPKHVAWVLTAAFVSSCGDGNTVNPAAKLAVGSRRLMFARLGQKPTVILLF
jgi:hypothetical protein